MTRLLPLLILLGLAAELVSIMVVGNALGVVLTLLLLLAGGFAGIGLIRSAGTGVVTEIRSSVQASSLQRVAAGRALARVAAGLLFIMPGFFSDLLGVLLLLPPVRRWLRTLLSVETVSAARRAGPRDGTIIEAEAIEIVGEIHPPDPAEGRKGARDTGD
jgi:UPF0716 protein FxsA